MGNFWEGSLSALAGIRRRKARSEPSDTCFAAGWSREEILATVGTSVLRLLFATIRLRIDDRLGFTTGHYDRPVIICFWHNRILGITLSFLRKYPHGSRGGVTVLTSKSKDGEILAGIARRIGMGAVRGSTSRNGGQALISLVHRVGANGDVAITPDGPRGPRYSLGPGAILLAKKTGAVIAPMHAKFSRSVRLKSWDGFIVPMPGSTITVTVGEMIAVPPEASSEEFEAIRRKVEGVLKEEAD